MNRGLYGKYRATVVDIDDPMQMGRIRVSCPHVYGESVSNWALPCIPNAWDIGGEFYMPPIGEGVWIEFEEGDPSKPIWTGGWYSQGKVPVREYNAQTLTSTRTIATQGSNISLRDGEISLHIDDLIVLFNSTSASRLLNLLDKDPETINYLCQYARSFRRN